MDPFLKWSLIVCVFIVILYKYGTRNFKYWKKKGVKQLSPFPFLGDNMLGMIKKQNLLESSMNFYKPFKDERFGGLYLGQKPFLSITDPYLLKQVMVKDADCFFNRHDWSMNSDPLMSKNLGNLKDENWKKMRTVLSTVFTSAKMKDMFGFMVKCAEQSVEFIQAKLEREKNQTGKAVYETNVKEFYSRYGCDVIGSTAFGFEVDSFKNLENEFYMAGAAIKNMFKGWNILKVFFIMTFPGLAKKFGLTFLGTKSNNFFKSLIETTIREREEKNIIRKDFIHILMEARKGIGVNENGEPIKGKLPDLTDLDIAAQAIVFFFAGFEAMSTLLSFVSYELAINPDIQEKLQREIDEIIEKENGITYDGVMHQMQYLNMVVHETLRKWPPAGATDRQVTKPYKIPKTEVTLNRGDSVWISIAALHYDPEYFPNPHKFDPERFRDEKNTIKPFTYLPFGEGLRHCVGMRYALMELKTVLVHLLKKYSFVPGKQTSIPIKLAKKGAFVLDSEDGFWLAIKPRD